MNWLIDDAVSTETFTAVQENTWQKSPFPEDVGTGGFEALELNQGITLFRSSYQFQPQIRGQLIPLALVEAKFAEPTFMAQTLTEGRVIQMDPSLPHNLIYGNGFDLFRYGQEIAATPVMDTTQNLEMTAALIDHTSLVRLLGEALFHRLLDGLGMHKMPSAVTREIPKFISRTLGKSMSHEYTGELKKLMAQAKVLEYFSQLLEYLGEDKAKRDAHKVINSRTERLYNHLVILEGKLPTLNELAAMFGCSARLLNDDFKAVYGESITAFIVNYRLNEAHEAIKSSPIPLKIVALKLGYSHVNHFITAFKKKFGYSPGSLRR